MQRRKRVVIFVILCLSVLSSWADSLSEVRTLLDRFQNARSSQRTAIANQLFSRFYAEELTDEQLLFSNSTPPDTLLQNVWYWSAEYFYAASQYNTALDYAHRALPLYSAKNSERSDVLNLLALINVRLSDYQEAAKYARECYTLDQASGDNDRISSTLNTLAGIYMSARLPQEAEKYVLKGIEVCEKTDNQARLAVLHGMAAEVYHALGRNDQSLDYATKACKMERQLGRKDKVAIRQAQMATAYLGLHRTKEAMEALQAAIPQFRTDGNRHSLALALCDMGSVLLSENKPTEAAAAYEEALDIFVEQGDIHNESRTRLGLYQLLKSTDPQQAMMHMERYNLLRDSLYKNETGELLSKYSAQLGNDQLLSDNQQARQHARQLLLVGLCVVAVLLLLIGGLYYLMRRRARAFTALSGDLDTLNQEYYRLREGYANVLNANTPDEAIAQQVDQQFVDQVVAVINQQMEFGATDVDSVASQLCMSPSQFRRRLSAIVGETPQAYIQRIRINRACDLFDTRPDLNITEVAMKCGYSDKSNFTRAFKRVYGITPSEYIKREMK